MTIPMWPLPNVSRYFEPTGANAQSSDRPNGHQHSGIDIPAPLGTIVYSPSAGTARTVRDNGYAGHSIYLDIESGHTVAFFHLDTISIADGQKVVSGQQIGTVGQSGDSLAPHLHISINTQKYFETNDIDVLVWLRTGTIQRVVS